MSGHSKWSTIKRKKGTTDAKKAKIFSKLVKEIYTAAKEGETDIANNAKLKVAIQNAKNANVPKDNIEKAINRAADKDSISMNYISYEAYGPKGLAIIIECLTDNVNRTIAFIRTALNRNSGNIAKTGALSHLFKRCAVFIINKINVTNIDDLTLTLVEIGAEDIDLDENEYIISAPVSSFKIIQKTLEDLKIEVESFTLSYIPLVYVDLSKEDLIVAENLINSLEDIDDIQNVYHNLPISFN